MGRGWKIGEKYSVHGQHTYVFISEQITGVRGESKQMLGEVDP